MFSGTPLQPSQRARVEAGWPAILPSSQLLPAKSRNASGSSCRLLPSPEPEPPGHTRRAEGGMCRTRGKAGGKVAASGLRPWPQPQTHPGL